MTFCTVSCSFSFIHSPPAPITGKHLYFPMGSCASKQENKPTGAAVSPKKTPTGILNGHPFSQPGRSVLWFAAYAKSDVEVRTVEILKGEQKHPDYVAKFPSAQVPTYEEGDFYLAESAAILQYLAADHAIVPKDKKQRAKVQQYIAANLAKVRTITTKLVGPCLFAKPEDVAALAKKGIEEVTPVLKHYDALLAKQSFVAGDTLSLADFLFTPEVDQLPLVKELIGEDLLTAYPSIRAYLEHMKGVQGYTANLKAAGAWLTALTASA